VKGEAGSSRPGRRAGAGRPPRRSAAGPGVWPGGPGEACGTLGGGGGQALSPGAGSSPRRGPGGALAGGLGDSELGASAAGWE